MISQTNRKNLSLALAAALTLATLATTSLWTDTEFAATLSKTDYVNARAIVAFQGMPLDLIAAKLDQVLDPGQPVAVDPQLYKSDFARQRLTEAFYPRQLDPQASAELLFTDSKKQTPPGGIVLTGQSSYSAIKATLYVSSQPKHRMTGPVDPALPLSLLGIAFCALGALGLGLAALTALRAAAGLSPPTLLAAGMVTGSLVIGIVTSVASWLQLALPRDALPGLGVVALVAVGAFGSLSTRLRAKPGAPRGLRLENLALAAILVVVVARFFPLPISLWDGRSIWFFQAKRIFLNGMLWYGDLNDPRTLWSHADYPILFPAWLSYFGGFADKFNEHQAAIGDGLLLCSTIALLWSLARARLGRWPGAAAALCLALTVDHAGVGGYADGLLCMTLACAFLARLEGLNVFFWLLLATASLLKAEGMVFAVCLAVPVVVVTRKNEPIWKPAACLLGALLPALGHLAWVKHNGADSLLKGASFDDTISNFIPRLGEVIAAGPSLMTTEGYTKLRAMLWFGLLAVVALVAVIAATRAKPPRAALAAVASAILIKLFAICSIALLPESAEWFVATALDRLLLLPCFLMVLALFLTLADRPATEPAQGRR